MQQDILKEDRENGIVNVKELLHTYIHANGTVTKPHNLVV